MTLKYSKAMVKAKVDYYKRSHYGNRPGLEKDATIKILAGKHLEKAKLNLVVAGVLWNISEEEKLKAVHRLSPDFKCYEATIEFAYYAMYHAAMSAMAKLGYRIRSHEAAAWALYYYYVHDGILDERLVDMFNKAKSLREEFVDTLEKGRQTRKVAAYEVKIISKDLAEGIKADAKGFVQEISKVLV